MTASSPDALAISDTAPPVHTSENGDLATPSRSTVPRPVRRADRSLSFYALTLAELEARCIGLGQPVYRARQLYSWVYQQLTPTYTTMSNLPVNLRAELTTELPLEPLTLQRALVTDDARTYKMLYRTTDGQFVETVLMLYRDRATVCVSCQIGCAVSCAFCATGIGGLTRNLSAGEMVAQVVAATRRARELGRPLTNVVMMGMGEPLQNYVATMKMVAIIHDPHGLNMGARRITISTSGVVPRIDALAEEPYQVNLAVSLHAPDDAMRDRLVPLNRRYPIDTLLAACARYIARTGRRVSFEYALMKGINDDEATARALAARLRRLICHVNLIPLNPVDLLPFERPEPAEIDRFATILREAGIPTTVRYSRGMEIAAACGQLRAEHAGKPLLASATIGAPE
ncbi:MAG: 23S rRNA (adenine(2503)-C(2))-methyltransferase RlmN [Chloroflexota bacterium]|nr:23S rRNA (adenine(2503)-C(2))-methyltransferase RlmN [Chloroflexota bacterium]